MKIKAHRITILLLIVSSSFCYAQDLEKGSSDVGFNYYKIYDVSGKYMMNNDTISSPLLIHFWYPSDGNAKNESYYFKNYIDLVAIRKNFNKPILEIDETSFDFANAMLALLSKNSGWIQTLPPCNY